MEALLGSDTVHPNVNLLTAIFFGLFFLCATQDIAVRLYRYYCIQHPF